MENDTVVVMRLSKGLKAKAERRAKQMGISLADYVRRLLIMGESLGLTKK